MSRIAERVRCPNGNSNIVPFVGIDMLLFRVVWVFRNMESHHAFGDEESLVVHLMPMGDGAGCLRWKNTFHCSEPLCCQMSEQVYDKASLAADCEATCIGSILQDSHFHWSENQHLARFCGDNVNGDIAHWQRNRHVV